MSLQNDVQTEGIRVNEPANPGRTYLSGKGLTQTLQIGNTEFAILEQVQKDAEGLYDIEF